MIQEVELVSRGFRLSSTLSPIARMEKNVKERKASSLRKITREALERVLTLQPIQYDYPKASDLGCDDGAIIYLKALEKSLKTSLSVHMTKTLYSLGCESSDPSLDTCSDSMAISTFYKLSHNSKPLSAKFQDESLRIEATLSNDTWIETFDSRAIAKKKLEGEKSLLGLLTKLQHEINTTNAIINLCKEEYVRACENNIDEDVVQEHLKTLHIQFSKINDNLKSSKAIWKEASLYLGREKKATTPISEDVKSDNITQDGDSLSLNNFPELENESLPLNPQEPILMIYEAEKMDDPDEFIRPRSKLTREERIELAKKERELASQQRATVENRMTMIKELKDVLSHREVEESVTINPLIV